jgi:hypothetical protein
MKLITKEIENRFKEVGSQENVPDPIIIAKFFSPVGAATWYAYEYNPEDRICFGYVSGLGENELGYFSIEEMESVKLPFGLSIERDMHFGERKLSEACPELKENIERRVELQKIEQQKEKDNEIER